MVYDFILHPQGYREEPDIQRTTITSECMGVNEEALQLCIILFFTTSHVRIHINTTSHMTICISTTSYARIHIRYYKLRENQYQVLQVTRKSISGTTSYARINIRYYKLCENSYHILQVTCAVSEHAMKSNVSIDEIIITIAPSYTGKNITCLLLLALLLQQTLDIFQYSFVLW